MSTLNDTDLFLVEREGQNYQITANQMSTLNDTDLLLVEREGVQYKVEAADLDLVPAEAPVATGSISYDNVTPNRFTEEEFTITAGAQAAAKTVSTSIKPYVVGLLDETDLDMHGLRFDPDRDTLMQRTASVGNQTTFTVSAWVKPLSGLIARIVNFSTDGSFNSGDNYFVLSVSASGNVYVDTNPGTGGVNIPGTLSPNKWHNVIAAVTPTSITIYADGNQIYNDTVDLSGLTSIDQAFVGCTPDTNHGDQYLSDVYFVDGHALEPSVFGHTVDGIWSPLPSETVEQNIAGGSFGANGFYLPFKSDLPSQNLITGFTDTTSISTSPNLSNGAIIGYSETAIAWSCSADVGGAGIQWYQSDDGIEWIYQGTANDGAFGSTFDSVPSKWICAGGSGNNARTIASTNGETFGWTQWEVDNRFDLKANTTTSDAPWFVVINSIGIDGSGQGNHFQASGFITPLPAGTEYGFKAVTYLGNGSNQTISGVGFKPDLVWSKARDGGNTPHLLVDSVRGVSQVLSSHSTGAEDDYSGIGGVISAFNSDGFDTGSNSDIATNGRSYVAWCWDAGDTTVANTDGSIASQVRANPATGFSVVSWTNPGGAGTVGHGLNAAPKFIITKSRTNAFSWATWADSLGTNEALLLNSTNAATDMAPNYWGSELPDSSVFGVGYDAESNNAGDMIAYCWSEVPGVSSFGSYTGNGSSTGPKITTGFNPSFLIIKQTNGANGWFIWDSERNPSNPNDALLSANSSDAEQSQANHSINFLSDGFQPADSNGAFNGNGDTYIYVAFADPNQPAPDTVSDTPVTDYAVLQGGVNGNLDALGSNQTECASTLNVTGKVYAECYVNEATNGQIFSVKNDNTDLLASQQITAADTGHVYGVTVDGDTGNVTFYHNGVQGASWVVDTAGGLRIGGVNTGLARDLSFNFGQQPYRYDPPEGYTGLFVESGGSSASTARLYAVLDADLNITDLQEADPGFTLVSSPATVTFPATLPSTETPDEALPEGTSFGSEILVSNAEGSDTATLAQVTPTN